MNIFPDRVHFLLSFEQLPTSPREIWRRLEEFLSKNKALPDMFEVSQIAGHSLGSRSMFRLRLSPSEIENLILEKGLTGFRVDTGQSSGSVGYHLVGNGFGCRIERDGMAPDDWSELIVEIMEEIPSIGAWQWRNLYQVWQWVDEFRPGHYERRFGSLPSGYSRRIVKNDDGIGRDREFIDISLNPGRPKELLPGISFYPTAEMWLGPYFWQYAKCSKEDVLAAEFFIEKRETPHFLYLRSWPEPFSRPDGEQGRQQQRLWKLFFHEDCEWPPGSGGICDDPMYGPPELMPGFQSPGSSSSS